LQPPMDSWPQVRPQDHLQRMTSRQLLMKAIHVSGDLDATLSAMDKHCQDQGTAQNEDTPDSIITSQLLSKVNEWVPHSEVSVRAAIVARTEAAGFVPLSEVAPPPQGDPTSSAEAELSSTAMPPPSRELCTEAAGFVPLPPVTAAPVDHPATFSAAGSSHTAVLPPSLQLDEVRNRRKSRGRRQGIVIGTDSPTALEVAFEAALKTLRYLTPTPSKTRTAETVPTALPSQPPVASGPRGRLRRATVDVVQPVASSSGKPRLRRWLSF